MDRALANNYWLDTFGTIGVEAITFERSDHLPIILNTNGMGNGGGWKKKIFHYEAKWANEEDGESPIRKVWKSQLEESNCWTKIQQKLRICSKELMKWAAKKTNPRTT